MRYFPLAILLIFVLGCGSSAASAAKTTPLPAVAPRIVYLTTPETSPGATPDLRKVKLHLRADGVGDGLFPISKNPFSAILRVNVSGNESFRVWSYDRDGKLLKLLVSEVAPYHGAKFFDIVSSQYTGQLKIESKGAWTVEALDGLLIVPPLVPGNYVGDSEDVIRLEGTGATKIRANMKQRGTLTVRAPTGSVLRESDSRVESGPQPPRLKRTLERSSKRAMGVAFSK
jgi:hypothetical protein